MRDRAYRRHHSRRMKAKARDIARTYQDCTPEMIKDFQRRSDNLCCRSAPHNKDVRHAVGISNHKKWLTQDVRNWESEYQDETWEKKYPIPLDKEDRSMSTVANEEKAHDSYNVGLLLAELKLHVARRLTFVDRTSHVGNGDQILTDPSAILRRNCRNRRASEVIEKALAAGADANTRFDSSGNTPLIEASVAGNAAIAEILLRSGADVASQNNDGETALIALAKSSKCSLKTLQLLINNGGDVNCQDASGNSPLHWAARSGARSILETLLTAGAASWITNKAGEMAVDVARDKATRRRIARAMRARIPRYNACLNGLGTRDSRRDLFVWNDSRQAI